MTSALTIDGLAKSYGDRPALAPLHLQVPAGQRVVLVGHNGSGKTTLLRLVAGLLDPTAGTATVFGHPIGSREARRALSWLSDTPTFYDDLSLWEHLEFVGRVHGSDHWEGRADELLARLHLDARRDDIPTTFSRGLRQKAAIALALVRPLELLLVDEPFVGLDQPGKETLLDLLAQVAAEGATVVVATHELSVVSQAERLLALRDGELVHDGPPGEADVHALVLPA